MNSTRNNQPAAPASQEAASRPRPSLLAFTFALALAGLAAPHANAADSWVPGRILVQPRAGLPDAALEKILKAHGAKSVGRIEAINVHIVQLPANASEKAVAAVLAHNPHLKFAELDMIVRPEATANDPYYGNAWHLPKIQAPTAWDSSTGQNVVIAILDTGVNSNHPDLAARMVAGWNFYDNNSNTADVYGHGTKVAGSAAAATNNSIGVAGVAGGARLMPLRISAVDGGAAYSAMASALTWAADHGANVANISYQSVSGSSTVHSAAQYLKNKGGVTVVAAGNTGVEQTFVSSDTMISVSATDSSDAKASWSSYGSYVDVAAPGTSIWTTTSSGGYGTASGTSFASPVTAGVVALMKSVNPALSPTDIASRLFSTAVDLGAAGKDKYFGYGRINAAAAVLAAKGAVTADTTAPATSITSPSGGTTVSGLVAVSVGATDNVGVSRVDLKVNGTTIASDTTAPYAFSWDSLTTANGSATLTAYAYDAAGNYSSSSAPVTVSNTTTATTTDTVVPVTTISNPLSGGKVSGTVSVRATSTDNVGVASTSLYINSKLKTTVTGSNLTYSWNTSKETKGTHTIMVVARDAAGNAGGKTIQVSK